MSCAGGPPRYLKAVGDPREIVSESEARYFGGRSRRMNTKGDPRPPRPWISPAHHCCESNIMGFYEVLDQVVALLRRRGRVARSRLRSATTLPLRLVARA